MNSKHRNQRLLFFHYLLVPALITACLPVTYPELKTPPPETTSFPFQVFTYNKNFGDGYIARIPTKEFEGSPSEEIIKILLAEWFDYFKTQTQNTDYKIRDYKIEDITLIDIPEGSRYKYVAKVRFSVIPVLTLSQWMGISENAIEQPDNIWWNSTVFFGVTSVDDVFNLFLLVAQV